MPKPRGGTKPSTPNVDVDTARTELDVPGLGRMHFLSRHLSTGRAGVWVHENPRKRTSLASDPERAQERDDIAA
jgi:hypothetical protein